MKKMIMAAVAGAIVAQIWSMLSWMVLPWHNIDIKAFKSDVAVAEVLKSQAVGTGIYTIPNMDPANYESEGAMAEWDRRAKEGPFAFISLRPDGIKPGMGFQIGFSIVLNILAGLLVLWILGKTDITCPKGRAVMTSVIVTMGAFLAHSANWAWWHFPFMYSLVYVLDMIIMWLLAGFVMAKVQGQKA